MLTESVGLAAVSSASLTTTTMTTSSDIVECGVPDAATVLASLRSKLVHCVHEQRHVERRRNQHFDDWFQQLVATPDFVASIDRWT